MKNRQLTLALRTLLTSAVIIALLSVSVGAVTAGASGMKTNGGGKDILTCKTETIDNGNAELNIGIAKNRDSSMFYFYATPLTYGNNYKSELDDSVSINVYDGYVANFISGAGNMTFDVTLNPPIVVEGACIIENNQVSVDLTNENFINAKKECDRSVAYGSCCFCYDHPEIFWIRDYSSQSTITCLEDGNGGYNAAITKVTVTASEAYSGAVNEISTVREGIENAVDEITVGNTRYETVKNIHDYICTNSTYNHAAASQNVASDAHTIAPLFNGTKKFVCEGYSKSFKVLCDRFNIPCALVIGQGGSEAHMWTYVKMDDNKWYAVDVTWDDTDQTPISDTYFLKGSNNFPNHTPNGYVTVDESVFLKFPDLCTSDYDVNWNQGNTSSTESSSSSASSSSSSASSSSSSASSSSSSASSSSSSASSSSSSASSSSSSASSSSSSPSSSSSSASSSSSSASGSTSNTSASGSTSDTSASQSSTTQTSATQPQTNDIAVKLDDPNNGFVKSAQIPETAKAKAGNDDVALDKIRIIVEKLDATKKKTFSDGIRKINNSFDPDNSILEVYDIKLVDGSGNTITITEGKLKLCLVFPSSQTKAYTNYVYSVYHQKNDGNLERITPVAYNAQGVWFENDKFSPIGLVSIEKSGGSEPSPGTGETLLMTVVAVIMLALATCAIAFVVIRNRKSDSKDEPAETKNSESEE